MKARSYLAAAAALVLSASAAQAITVDGTIDAGEYAGAMLTYVPYDAATVPSFGPLNTTSEFSAYNVYYTSDATNVYVALETLPAGAGLDGHDSAVGLTFANLYFNGIGFEVFNDRAFRPGVGGYYNGLAAAGAVYDSTVGTTYANGGAPSIIELSIPWTVFMENTLGVVGFNPIAEGGSLQLRISQSFGYAAVSGDGHPGDMISRFGSVTAPMSAVPEPASWAMMIGGFGLAGAALRRKAAKAALAAA